MKRLTFCDDLEIRDVSQIQIRPQKRDSNAFPLSIAQERLWFLDQLEPGNPAYNISQAYRVTGRLNVTALERSLGEIVRRHEILRTTFPVVDGQPVQVISPDMDLTLPIVDLRELSETEREAEAQRRATEEAQQPFDLARGPLLRVKLLRLSEDERMFLLTMHHIISDDWSLGVFMRELAALYEAFSAGKPSPLPELPIQYADFAVWQRRWLQSEMLKSHLNYWKQQLGDSLSVLQLPTDRPRPPVQTYRGARQSLELSKDLSDALKLLSQREGVALFVTLLAAFKTLLYRYTGQEDIIVGSPIANRNRAEIEGLIGFFVNTLVLRTDLSGNPSFRELLARMREVTLGAYTHQDLPFEKLVAELQPERDLSRTPLFQVFFNMLVEGHVLELRGLTVEHLLPSETDSKFDLTLYVREQDEGIHLKLVYNTDLFYPERMTCFLQQFRYLLEQIVAAPEKPIGSYSLVTPESRSLLPDPSAVLTEPGQELVTSMFAAWAQRMPEQPAISQGKQTWLYAELAECADTLARALRAKGLERGDIVAVYGPQSFGLIASMIGVLLSGGVLLPLDRNLPSKRKQLILREAAAESLVYVGSGQLEDAWLEENSTLDILFVDVATGRAVDAETGADPATIPLPELTPDDAAYVFFTSGTTGVPKGVLGCHKGLGHFLNWQRETFAIGPQDRSSQLTGLSFDVVLRDIFLPLTSGATLCLPEDMDSLGPDDIMRWLERERISILHTVPVLVQSWLANVPEVSLRAMRWVFFAGEPLTETLVRRWRAAFPGGGGEIVNLYGPTETTLAKCFYQVPADVLPGVQPVGWPLPQTQALVVAADNQLCGIGEPGEIVLRTPFRSLGYINAPEESQKQFVKNSFRDDEQDLLYYTGDRGRYRPDGALEILGRLDDQVKIRGVRVEPGEVTATLARHPAVKSCFVTSRKDEQGQIYLVAYVVASKQHSVTIPQLRSCLSEQLPAAMIPAAFVFLEQLPLTPNGKVDRHALLAPDQARPEGSTFVAPRTPVEEVVTSIWSQVLGLEQIGVYDNFFELGGHSLLATQVISRLCNAFQLELPLRCIFEAPTVAELSAVIEKAEDSSAELRTPIITPVSREAHRTKRSSTGVLTGVKRVPKDNVKMLLSSQESAVASDKIYDVSGEDVFVFPMSFAQQRLWFLDQLEPGNPAYNISAAYHLSGPLNVTALSQSINETVRRHEALRTTFATADGRPVQVIAPALILPLPVIDLCDLPENERETQVQQLVTEESRWTFDLAQGPLLRTTLLRLGEAEHVLIMVMHHIVSDEWSMGILSRELATLYEAFSMGKPSPLPELSIQYVDLAVWQQEWLQGNVLERQLAYWKQQLDSPSVLQLPTDRSRPVVQSHRGARQSLMLSESLAEALKALSQREGVTLFMTLLAAFKTLLYRYTGQDDIIVGTPIANRNRSEIEGLIGFFVNTLVLRTDLSGNPSFRELLSRVREMALEAYVYQDLPFEKLVEELHLERNLSHSPLFQVMFALQNVPGAALDLPDLKLNSMEVEDGTAKFDLTLSMIEGTGGLQGILEYNTDLFDAATIKRMGGHFRTLLEGIVANPDQPIAMLPLLTEAERHQLLVEWNDTQADYPKDLCIHQLFETQVERTPEAIAVVSGGKQVTYREMNRQANQLAHHLQKLGVGPEVLVGICMERSLELAVGILGILKAGGAYVPLDPAYPKERLAFMLEDTQAPVMLTQQRLVEKLPEHGAEVVCLDSSWEIIAQQSEVNPVSRAGPENLAYVIYTSGSTGTPKGVQIEHRGLLNLVFWHQRAFAVSQADQATQIAGLSFDATVWELWPYLTAGASIHFPPDEETRTLPTQLRDWLVSEGITISFLPTPLAENVLSPSWPNNSALRILLTGGDKLHFYPSPALPFELVNNYGPTEYTVVTTSATIPPNQQSDTPPPIGRPIANTQVYLLDQHLQPVPIGVSGELYVGGDGLARGYLNRPELTAEKFILNPFSHEPGARLYKTGDLARYLPNGNIEFLGRIDHQVKIRGFRIELGEIEAVLRQHPAVQETVVMAREDVPGDKRLVAYSVVNQEPAPSISELRRFLQGKLPEYMVPFAFVILDALPLMPNGKVDRRALPSPDQSRLELQRAFVSPRDTLELQLAKIWEQVLGLQPIGVRDNFFDLGGHSLLAVRLFAQIEKVFGQSLPLATLFQAPTVEQLASVLRQKGWSMPWSSLVAIQPGGSKRPFFCVPGNLGNVFVDLGDLARHLGPDQPFYGLQDGIQNPSQIEALATHYVDEIRTVQSKGPYLLGGVCSGGVVAFEMAQQLQAQGQKVALLALVEPPHPSVPGLRSYIKLAASLLHRFARRFGHHLRNVPQRGSVEQGAYIRLKAKLVANSWALRRYTPQPYPGRIALFLANGSLTESPYDDPRSGWRELATGGVEVHVVPGTHDTITRTHDAVPEESQVQVLAEQMRACIDEAQLAQIQGDCARCVHAP